MRFFNIAMMSCYNNRISLATAMNIRTSLISKRFLGYNNRLKKKVVIDFEKLTVLSNHVKSLSHL